MNSETSGSVVCLPWNFWVCKTSGVLHTNFASAISSTFVASRVLGNCLVSGFPFKSLIPVKQKFFSEFVGWDIRTREREQLSSLFYGELVVSGKYNKTGLAWDKAKALSLSWRPEYRVREGCVVWDPWVVSFLGSQRIPCLLESSNSYGLEYRTQRRCCFWGMLNQI